MRIPYGTFSKDRTPAQDAFYNFGYRHDEDLPPLPEVEPDEMIEDPERDYIHKELGRVLREMLDQLTPRQATVLRLRFGIDRKGDHTLEEIGKIFGVSRDRIRQIECGALRKLKHYSNADMLRPFVDPDWKPLVRFNPPQLTKDIKKERRQDTKVVATYPSWVKHLEENEPDLFNRLKEIERKTKIRLLEQYEVPVSP